MPKKGKQSRDVYFLRNEQPSVSRALPPVGWQRTVVQPWQMTTVWAWEKTVVMVKHPGHLTSMKKERGAGTSCWWAVSKGVLTPKGKGSGKSFPRQSYLELVLAGLGSRAGVEKINGENLEESIRQRQSIMNPLSVGLSSCMAPSRTRGCSRGCRIEAPKATPLTTHSCICRDIGVGVDVNVGVGVGARFGGFGGADRCSNRRANSRAMSSYHLD
jgi:hypothetical protein